ncbi:MAG TPA: alpha-2-macroglobulin family protein, partial [Dyadobacter sp.]|nr:alpha-2-macroglobulin family protein [Dyadobacter sp.]
SVTAGKKFSINNKLAPGFYQIEILTNDKNGEEVKLVKSIELTDPENNQLTNTRYLWTGGSKPIEPGQKTNVQLGTSADNLFVVHGITKEANEQQTEYSFFKLSNEKRSFDFTATEQDRGGYGLTYMFVKHNRFYEFNDNIDVPWTNKDLKIEYTTFRDKTLPGSDEKWKVKISGYKKEKVAAEMLGSMYDASLDQFYAHNWAKPNVWPRYYNRQNWNSIENFSSGNANQFPNQGFQYKNYNKIYDQLIEPAAPATRIQLRGRTTLTKGMAMESAAAPAGFARYEAALNDVVSVDYEVSVDVKKDEANPESGQSDASAIKAPQIRKNFNETAFWLPDLHTNEAGEIEFSFTLPDALTRWKFQALSHTKDLAFGYSSKEIVTQKDLMVQPNAPRFLREGDQITFNSKIGNLTDKVLNGTVTFQLFDTETNAPVDGLFGNTVKSLPFTAQPKQSATVQFPLSVPKNFNKMVTWRITAKAGAISDGEENMLPVLPNRMLVTESVPLTMRGTENKTFKFEKLLNSGKSKTLVNHALTIEYTSNPVWYAVQALPYLMEYPYDCAEQTWNRYYANALAASIANSSPRIAKVLENWRTADTTALLSNLQKNEELKSVLLEETPWVLEGKSEAEQKRNIALLFDLIRMGKEMNLNLEKVKQMQSSNGGFVWFKGGPDDRYMTQYIVSGIGHLQKLNAVNKEQLASLQQILDKAIPYLDLQIRNDYDELMKNKTNTKDYTPGSVAIQYLYMRSFFPDYKIAAASLKAVGFFTEQSRKTWTTQNKYMQGMIALASHRAKDVATSKAILKSLGETAIRNEELGMYWKTTPSWWWHENAIERQALLIEAFHEAGNDTKTVDDLRTWLLKNKQTNRWESTKATAEACYALLLQGTEWLSSSPETTIQLGKLTVKSTDEKQQEGTGYFKKTIQAEQITPEMGNIKVNLSKAEKGKLATSWGTVYWQYFEDLDKITFAETPLKIEKKLFVERNADSGPVLTPVESKTTLHVGDKIKVRIVLRVDRDMEYVHMKDMRASSLEPTNVLSGYKWQGGLGYYESTKDAATNFFFNLLRKGTYVF